MSLAQVRAGRAAIFIACFVASTVALVNAPVARAEPTCDTANTSAGATATGAQEYGARGYITSSNVSVPNGQYNDSFQHFTAVSSDTNADGIEVGWFVGWDEETGTFDISPHAYVTLNGPHQLDGPAVGQTTDWYSTYWSGANQEWVIRQNQGGTLIWSGSQSALGYSGPGTLWGAGEIIGAASAMKGTFEGNSGPLEFFDGSAWHYWPGISLCADPGYSSSGTVNQYVDSGSGG
jgi:hypothetical protein